jgi:hypothetical protein
MKGRPVSVDSNTMIILTAVGAAGVTAGGKLWKALRDLYVKYVASLKAQNVQLEKRTSECEEDRKLLHGRLNDQGERITELSGKIGRLEGQIGRHRSGESQAGKESV